MLRQQPSMLLAQPGRPLSATWQRTCIQRLRTCPCPRPCSGPFPSWLVEALAHSGAAVNLQGTRWVRWPPCCPAAGTPLLHAMAGVTSCEFGFAPWGRQLGWPHLWGRNRQAVPCPKDGLCACGRDLCMRQGSVLVAVVKRLHCRLMRAVQKAPPFSACPSQPDLPQRDCCEC